MEQPKKMTALEKEKSTLCPVCGQSYSTRRALQEHFRFNHDTRIQTCEICHKEIMGKAKLKFHKRIHRLRKCTICQGDVSVTTYDYHMKRYHLQDDLISCKICDYSTVSEHNYRKHLEARHKPTIRRSYQCRYCDERFPYQKDYKNHMSSHLPKKKSSKAEERYDGVTDAISIKDNASHCNLCDYKSKRPYNVKRHIITRHSEEKRRRTDRTCGICGVTFTRRYTLRKHYKRCEERFMPLVSKDDAPNDQGEAKFHPPSSSGFDNESIASGLSNGECPSVIVGKGEDLIEVLSNDGNHMTFGNSDHPMETVTLYKSEYHLEIENTNATALKSDQQIEVATSAEVPTPKIASLMPSPANQQVVVMSSQRRQFLELINLQGKERTMAINKLKRCLLKKVGWEPARQVLARRRKRRPKICSYNLMSPCQNVSQPYCELDGSRFFHACLVCCILFGFIEDGHLSIECPLL